MSVQSYLDGLASKLVLADGEKASITTSINALSSRINSYFGAEVREHFIFGSYPRGTILPRKVDERSDIDYLITFENLNNYKPQTFLNKLKNFVEYYYSTSEIHQSHPSIVLELQHIKFELVPANKDWLGIIYIPSPATSYQDWMTTDPSGFNATLTSTNTNNGYKIKPLIRLMKYWNILNGRYYSSFLLEKWICENWYLWCTNLKEYLFSTIDKLSYNYSDPDYVKRNIDRAKQIIANVKYYESQGQISNAETEIKKLLPDF